jgi:putative endonuclease
MYYVYVIKSFNRNYIYVGISDDPNRRINHHNSGYNRTTKPYLPFKTILIEEHQNRLEARKREKYLKSGFGKEFLKGRVAELVDAQDSKSCGSNPMRVRFPPSALIGTNNLQHKIFQ